MTAKRYRHPMPCRIDVCAVCNECICKCNDPLFKKWRGFDFEGALCDLLTLLEAHDLLKQVDKKTLEWWGDHEEREADRIKREALAKLTPRERRVLGLK